MEILIGAVLIYALVLGFRRFSQWLDDRVLPSLLALFQSPGPDHHKPGPHNQWGRQP